MGLDIFAASSLCVPSSKLLRFSGRAVLLVKRFDRKGQKRIPYISGLSAISGSDGQDDYSYLDLVDFLAQEGANTTEEKCQLWLHALLSAAIGNTDNHMRNFGFLRSKQGWQLSPFFDINPTRLDAGNNFSVSIADAAVPHSIDSVMENAQLYDIDQDKAHKLVEKALLAISNWRKIALSYTIKEASIAAMQPRMELAIDTLKNYVD